jgi:hypothetical protein
MIFAAEVFVLPEISSQTCSESDWLLMKTKFPVDQCFLSAIVGILSKESYVPWPNAGSPGLSIDP